MVRSAINKVKTPGDAVAKDEEKEAILPTILFTSVQLSAVWNPVCVVETLSVSPFEPCMCHPSSRCGCGPVHARVGASGGPHASVPRHTGVQTTTTVVALPVGATRQVSAQ